MVGSTNAANDQRLRCCSEAATRSRPPRPPTPALFDPQPKIKKPAGGATKLKRVITKNDSRL